MSIRQPNRTGKPADFFYMSWRDKPNTTIAKAPAGTLGYELGQKISGHAKLPFDLTYDGSSPPDYLPNSIAWPLVSENLKNLIVHALRPGQTVCWIQARIVCQEAEMNYFVPRFDAVLEVINLSKSIVVRGDFIVKAHLDISKAGDYEVFTVPGVLPFTSRIIVSKALRDAIRRARMTGMVFEKVAGS